jgi:hypothetical protein
MAGLGRQPVAGESGRISGRENASNPAAISTIPGSSVTSTAAGRVRP